MLHLFTFTKFRCSVSRTNEHSLYSRSAMVFSPAGRTGSAHDGASEAMSRLWLAGLFFLTPHHHRPDFSPISAHEAAIVLLTSI